MYWKYRCFMTLSVYIWKFNVITIYGYRSLLSGILWMPSFEKASPKMLHRYNDPILSKFFSIPPSRFTWHHYVLFCFYIVQWVVTNLRPSGSPGLASAGFSWVFNLEGIAEMYQSYEETNLWYIHRLSSDHHGWNFAPIVSILAARLLLPWPV